ncbi:MAG: PorP/SprF family type IX secretion system membrane protein [Tannerella sp.]|jgi:type IX secretion system PorP/SprF family membrane protein|nr:PorP/SprF family type IX secretion system membrane protein [Tannerella sp.]
MRRIVLLLIIISGCVHTAQAQRDAQFSQYHMALGYYNPATAGKTGNLDVVALYRLQWLGWDNAPKTLFATADMPFRFLNREHGVGVMLLQDNLSSIKSSMTAGLQYAFLKKAGKGTFRIGVQLGMISLSDDGTKVILPVDSLGSPGADDGAIPTSKVGSKSFDANLGIYYHTDKWYVGIASMHLLEPQFDDENYSDYIERTYNFVGGYNIQMKNTLLELQPSVFMQTNFNTYKVNVTTRAVYARKYSAGLSWRVDENIANGSAGGLVVMLGAIFGKIEGGYAYDVPLSGMGIRNMGSHELFLKYRMQLNKPKTGKSKHKSVRIL